MGLERALQKPPAIDDVDPQSLGVIGSSQELYFDRDVLLAISMFHNAGDRFADGGQYVVNVGSVDLDGCQKRSQ